MRETSWTSGQKLYLARRSIHSQPDKTILPILPPDSRSEWALRRFSALMGEIVLFTAGFSFPSSTQLATADKISPCLEMSGVSNIERVNMSSQLNVALFRMSKVRSRGRDDSTI